MKRNYRIRDMVFGAVLASLIFSLASPAMAALTSMSIEAFTGIKVYVNDQLVDPRDANGDPVEVLVYNGTTYLPIRAIGNALGLPVQYDGATQSAYIGKHNSETPAIYLDEFDYFSGDEPIKTAEVQDDNLKESHSRCITDDFERTYKLNGQYSRLTGTLYQEYDRRSEKIYGENAALRIYGDGKLLYSREFKEDTTGFEPETVDADLTGVLELKIEFLDGGEKKGSAFFSSDRWYYGPLALGEMALYT